MVCEVSKLVLLFGWLRLRFKNLVKKHIKPNSKNPQGGIEEKESPIHISNVSLVKNEIKENAKNEKSKANKTIKKVSG